MYALADCICCPRLRTAPDLYTAVSRRRTIWRRRSPSQIWNSPGKSAGGSSPSYDFHEYCSTIAPPTPERSPSPFSLALRRARNTNVIHPLRSMASLSANHFSTASKRSRSQQSSPAPLESPPVPKATKTEDSEDEKKIPAFLRQSRAGKFTPSGRFVDRRGCAYAASVLKDRPRQRSTPSFAN